MNLHTERSRSARADATKSLLPLCAAAAAMAASAAQAQPHAGHTMPQPAPAPAKPAAESPSPAQGAQPHAEHTKPQAQPAQPQASAADHGQMAGMDHGATTGALGPYPMTREASGTGWQPDASEHAGAMSMGGDWMLMGHALLNGVYDWQEGPRGDEKTFVAGMVMGMARREFSNGDALQFGAMLSPDPFLGKRGYPLLLAAGESADGITPLIDRQHPHELFMELSASYSHRLSDRSSVFLYADLPDEPAVGPPAFMHRLSIMDSPGAPISHHWLDSTHIVFGLVTVGFVYDSWKVEVSRFKGREPDEDRYDIENPSSTRPPCGSAGIRR